MKFTALFVTLSSLGCVSADSIRRRDIVGGSAAGSGEAGFYTYFSTGDCGGTLIDEKHVLTSAQCLANGAPPRVYVGATDRTETTGTEMKVNCGYIHPDYDPGCDGGSSNADIAILRLVGSCTGCEVAVLNTGNNNITVGDTINQYGLGRTSEGGDYPDKLQKTTTLEAISDADCQAVWGDLLPGGTDNYFCANKAGEAGYCDGDYGGPATVTNAGKTTVVGVMIKMNATCGFAPDVFTDVATYQGWINDVIASEECNVQVPCGQSYTDQLKAWWNGR